MTPEEKDAEIQRLQQLNTSLSEQLTASQETLKAWLGWFEEPFAEGVDYINPPLKKTKEVLAK